VFRAQIIIECKLHVFDLMEGMYVYFLKAISYHFLNENPPNCNSPVQ